MKHTTLNIKGMHCTSCEMIIKDSLEDLDGVNESTVSHTKGTATISFDDTKVTENDLKELIRKEGYEVE